MTRTITTALASIALAALAPLALLAQSSFDELSPTNRVGLFDGKTLSGWTLVSKGTNASADSIWSAADGVIHCKGKPNGYMRTIRRFRDYQLHTEWRWPEGPGNSGLFVHVTGADKVWPTCLEVQLQSGNAGEVRMNGGSKTKEATPESPNSVPRRQAPSERPVGEWNTCDIICRGNTMTVRINGVLQNEVTEASVSAGAIALQAEGKPVEFRNIYVEPLPVK